MRSYIKEYRHQYGGKWVQMYDRVQRKPPGVPRRGIPQPFRFVTVCDLVKDRGEEQYYDLKRYNCHIHRTDCTIKETNPRGFTVPVAQWIECLASNQEVAGSTPAGDTTDFFSISRDSVRACCVARSALAAYA